MIQGIGNNLLINKKGGTGIPYISYLTTAIIGSRKFFSATKYIDGNVYLTPYEYTRYVKIVPSTETITNVASAYPATPQKWNSAILGTSGKIYGNPWNRDTIGILDTPTETSSEVAFNGDGYLNLSSSSSVQHPNGFIYIIPRSHSVITKFDPTTDTWIDVGAPFAPLANPNQKFSSAVISADGHIYSVGHQYEGMLKFDPVTDTYSIISLGGYNFRHMCLGLGNVVYLTNLGHNNIAKFDLSTDTFTLITGFSVPDGSYFSSIMGIDGKIYFLPNTTTDILVLDPTDDSASYIALPAGVSGGYSRATITDTGDLLFIPWNEDFILKLNFVGISNVIGGVNVIPPDIADLKDSEYNRYYNN